MIPNWYNLHNKDTGESRSFRSNDPLGVAFKELGNDKYAFKEIEPDHWLVDNKLEVREIKNINPFWSLK